MFGRRDIFTDDEIERMLIAADHAPFTEQNPARKHQIPVIFRILFNCGLRTSELLKLRMCDVDLKENVFTICVYHIRYEISQKPFGTIFRFGFGGLDSISGNVPTTISRFIDFSQFKPSQQWREVWKQLAANSIPPASQNGRDSL